MSERDGRGGPKEMCFVLSELQRSQLPHAGDLCKLQLSGVIVT
jgi:hypothetical protein